MRRALTLFQRLFVCDCRPYWAQLVDTAVTVIVSVLFLFVWHWFGSSVLGIRFPF